MKNIVVVLLVAALVACSSPRDLVLTETNRTEIAQKIGESSMTDEEKQLFMGALAREAMGAMAKAFGMPAPSMNGKTVGQIIDEQKKYAADMEAAMKQEEAKSATEKAKTTEANRLIGSAVQVTISDVNTSRSSFLLVSKISLTLANSGAKDVAALVGDVVIEDLFGKQLVSKEIRVNKTIPAGKTVSVSEDIYDEYSLKDLSFDKIKARWVSRAVAFTDGTAVGEAK